jgi:hypothetical protein
LSDAEACSGGSHFARNGQSNQRACFYVGSSHFTQEALNAYLNLANQSAKGKNIDSAQFNFSADDLNYIASHYIHLGHEQQFTASGGVAYLWNHTTFSADLLEGSGLRASLALPDGSVIPNGDHLPYYAQVNLGVNHILRPTGARVEKACATIDDLIEPVVPAV